jgi:diazepam-binding inhibitor (GABA receptor modulating acyl-CoA-binding protein)
MLYFASKTARKIPGNYRPSTLTTLEITMADLKAKFEAAAANSKNLTERPDNSTLLKIYALYKQGSTGDNTEKKPGFSDMVGRAKWDAWNGLKGTASADAMQQYIDLIESLS